MQKDEEVGKVAQATPIVICMSPEPSRSPKQSAHVVFLAKALEMFLGLIVDQSCKITQQRGSRKVEAYHLKHAVETTEMLDFLKEIVEAVPDPSAGGTIDLESENAEAGAKKRRGKGKKAAAGNGDGEPAKKRRKKKASEPEIENADEDMGEGAQNGSQTRQVMPSYRPRSPSSDDDGYDED
ncbi:hypothetical protein H0H93_016139 [Arthromyces matolae]|nr:hypothetical protein H0H93_016139 [Arthromyces matolae]